MLSTTPDAQRNRGNIVKCKDYRKGAKNAKNAKKYDILKNVDKMHIIKYILK